MFLAAVVFLQQALMFCPIFPDNPSLHKTCNQLSGYSRGTRRLSYCCYISPLSGTHGEENPALLFGARIVHCEQVVWEERHQKCMKVVVLSSKQEYIYAGKPCCKRKIFKFKQNKNPVSMFVDRIQPIVANIWINIQQTACANRPTHPHSRRW